MKDVSALARWRFTGRLMPTNHIRLIYDAIVVGLLSSAAFDSLLIAVLVAISWAAFGAVADVLDERREEMGKFVSVNRDT